MMPINLMWQALIRRWWLVVIPTVIVLAVSIPQLIQNEQSGAGGYQTSFRYSAAQSSSNLPNRDGDYQDVWLASEFVVNAFTDWVRSSTFRSELAQVLDNADLLNGLNIAADNSRSIGVVYMSHPDSEALAEIANASITILRERNREYFPQLGEEPAVVTVIDAPVITPAPAPLTNRFAPLVRIAFAFALGCGLALGAHYLDSTIRTRREVEQQGLKVIAVIPKHR